MNLVKVGDKVRTSFVSGIVTAVIDGRERGWRSSLYFEIRVTTPRMHYSKRRQVIRLDEIKAVS